MSEVKVTWFVEPLDSATNKVIAEFLTVTEVHCDKLCADGRRRDLWDCDYRFVARLLATTEQLGLQYKLFRKRGGGQIEHVKKDWLSGRKRKRLTQPAGAT